LAKESDCKAGSNAYGHSFANTDCNSCPYSDCFANTDTDSHADSNTDPRTNWAIGSNYIR
jgi:hypothetical protein